MMTLAPCSVLLGADSTGLAITADMLKPVLDSVTANIGVILPVAIALFGIMVGINLIPKLFRKFTS